MDLGEQHWNNYYNNIMFIDSQAVYESARRHTLQPQIIVIIGNGSIVEHLREFEDIEVYNYQGEYQYRIKGERE